MSGKVLGIILAGGMGKRLFPLTQQRAKPAVPFGAKYRIIDFVLSNFINSEIYSIYVLVQFKSQSLLEHLRDGWMVTGPVPGSFITPVPAQMQTGENWYRGTGDALRQNLHLVKRLSPEIVAVFNADHIYQMDIREMIRFHREKHADVTVASYSVPVSEANSFGVLKVNQNGEILGHEEKPEVPCTLPNRPDTSLISMGNYLFNPGVLCNVLEQDPAPEGYDLARDIIPLLTSRHKVVAYDFRKNRVPGLDAEENTYWHDIGTIKAFFDANMELTARKPSFNLYNRNWPLRTATYATPPIRFTKDQSGKSPLVESSLIAGGSVLSGGTVRNSIVGRNVRIGSGCVVENSIIFDNAVLFENVMIKRTIIDKNVTLTEGTRIGYDAASDTGSYFVDPSGIVVVTKE
ncbi:MAG: glucose-1-phosphate adenylyltransferase [Pseudomonadota bacterium]